MSWESNFIENFEHTITPMFKEKLINNQMNKGLYLIGQTTFNPYTGELFYWIKVGTTNNIKSRISGYKTHTPTLFYIDWLDDSNITTSQNAETLCHIALHVLSKQKHGDEWFSIDRLTYLNICQKGFEEICLLVQAITGIIITKKYTQNVSNILKIAVIQRTKINQEPLKEEIQLRQDVIKMLKERDNFSMRAIAQYENIITHLKKFIKK